MANFNLTYDLDVTLEQRLGFEMAAQIWSQFLTDDTQINLHISAASDLNDGQAVGGAVPIFHEVHYGVYQEYLALDATSEEDASVLDALQDGNTVDVWVDGELVDGNTTIMLTRAQAKALGMDETLVLEDGSTWTHDMLQDPNALDGYVVINSSYDWNYDFTREADIPEGELDFLTMALHELGHSLGFVSGLDGLMETFEMHSGEIRTEGFTALDLLRYSDTSVTIENPDGTVSDLSFGGAAYFSLDGGVTELAEFEEGDEYQASHWQRFQNAIGVMDPTLGYQERTNISQLDLQAFDVLGWDVDYASLQAGLDLNVIYDQALQAISQDFGVGVASMEEAMANGQDWYTLARGAWWEALKDQILELGHGGWWQQFEAQMAALSPGGWWQSLNQQMLALGPGSWWQLFEDQVLALGHGGWWQQFEADMLALSPGGWWQVFEPQMVEMSFGGWWQVFEQQMLLLGHGGWWQAFEAQLLELGHGSWWQAFAEDVLALGPGSWWQLFEDKVLELGHGGWWQQFEVSMLELSPGGWWQAFELSPGGWWQLIEQHVDTVKTLEEIAPEPTADDTPIVVSGGGDDDILAGSHSRDIISGGAGDDLVDGKHGDDILLGNDGDDIIYGWDGADILFGGDGDDLLAGEDDNDQIFGEAGADILSGGRGDDILDGGEGRDVLKGDIGHDVLMGGSEEDRISGGSGEDLLIGGAGQDVVEGGDDNDVLYGDNYFVPIVLANTPSPEASNSQPVPDSVSGETDPTANLDFWMRLEAENMWLINYAKEEQIDASGGDVIATQSNQGKAKTTFHGPSGTYDLVVGYYDEAGGSAEITLEIKGQGSPTTYTWQLNGATGAGTYQISGVALESGDRIELKGNSDGTDLARLDYIDVLTAGATASFDQTGTPTGDFYNYVGDTQSLEGILQVEVEQMDLSGGAAIEQQTFASGGGYVMANPSDTFHATSLFSGETGYYDIVVGHYDDNDGAAEIIVKVDNQELGRWYADQDLGSASASANSFTNHLVAEGVQVSNLDLIELIAIEDNGDQANLDYIQFIKVEPETVPHLSEPIRVEAEDMTLSGDSILEDQGFASGGQLMKTASSLTATTEFTGPEGLYNIIIGYWDENDGNSPVTVKLDGATLDSWIFDQDLGNGLAGIDNFVTRTVASAVTLNAGVTLELQTSKESGEYARIDYVEFVSVNPDDAETPAPEEQQSGENGDVLRGGAGNDTAYGGQGDDSLYGDSGDDVLYGDFGSGTVSVSANNPPATLTFLQGVNSYTSAVDTYIHGNNPSTSYGGSTSLNVDGSDGGDPVQGLIRFDDIFGDQAGQIALDDTINSAILELNVSDGGDGLQVYDMLQSWSDSATWNSLGNGIQADGVEAASAPVATTGSVVNGVLQIDVTASLQAWRQNPTANYGWALLSTGGNGVDFDSTEGNNAPRLIVDVNQTADPAPAANAVNLADLPTGGFINNATGSYYLAYETKVAWEDAQAYAESLGGNLVTINDAAEQAWLETTFDLDSSRYWIGLTDREVEGEFKWVTGEAVAYTNWEPGNPNDSGASGSSADYVSTDGPLWNDADSTQIYRSIIEFDLSPTTDSGHVYNGSRYLLTDPNLSWVDAQAQAESLGGNLVTINDTEEEQWIQSTFGEDERFWIGLSDAESEGVWKWASGEIDDWYVDQTNPGIYTNWSPGQPDDHNEGQDYAVMNYVMDGETLARWDDRESTNRHRGLIEIKLFEGAGNDSLTGGAGNDTLFGDEGDDILNGADSITMGLDEQDILSGGDGADQFILGEASSAYYHQGGSADFVTIQDFDLGVDTVQLFGASTDYSQTAQGANTLLYWQGQDLVAQFNGITSLDLNHASFQFVN